MPNTQSEALKWEPCFVDPKRGIAFFDGITIESDPITDPRWDRVLPVLEEEQIFVCRQMYLRFEQALKDKQDVWVLDVGTGNGVFAIWAAKKWKCKVVAIDINPRALMIAEKNASKNDIRVCHSREELEKIAREKETGVILLECIKFDSKFREKYSQKFDLVFLSPSYTPIIDPTLIPPLYDTLGGDGQKSFQDQISLVPEILKEDGSCIGHQMTPVRSDKKMTAVTKIQETFKEHWKLRYTHILDKPESYPSIKFLKEVYQFYLCPQESCNNLSRSRAIKGSINEFSKTNHYLAFIYYEVSREEGKELIWRRYRVHQKNWDHRIKMHRAVVENTDHSSKGNFFPLPSLFTRKSPIPQLPGIDLGNLSETEVTPQHQWENSPLKTVDCWINKAQILEFLDLIVVDIVPYDYLGGLQKICQESKIWLQESDKYLAEELLKEWLLTIQDRKKAGVTQRLHPGFVGTKAPDQWRDIQYTLLPQQISSITSKFNLTEKEIKVLNSIEEELKNVSKRRESLPKKKLNFSEDRSYSIWTLEDQDEYPDNEKMETRIDDMQIGNHEKAILMDLRLCHLGIHQHLDKRYSELLNRYDKRYEKKDCEWSALIGLPLSPSFHPIKGKIDAGIDNNSYYRGAFWIYARSSNQWALKQERKLFDLARFLWLMYESKYNAEAYASLYALKNFQASSVFGHEVKHISYAISHRWLAKPNNDLKELVGEFPEWGWGDQWRVIPLPELLETAGKVIRLWCQTNNPRDVFNPLPKTMAELVQQCWQLAKDSIKPRFSYKFDLSEPKELKQVKDLLDQVDQLWQDKFKIIVDEKVPKPDWSEKSSQQWMELARLFFTAFGNCVKYANTEKDIIVKIKYLEDDQKIEIAIINDLEDDTSQSKLHDQIKMARQRVQTAPLIRQYSGSQILSLYVIRLGGTLLKRPKMPNTDIYKVEIKIPIKSLSGRPT